jgi:hypothetical protein
VQTSIHTEPIKKPLTKEATEVQKRKQGLRKKKQAIEASNREAQIAKATKRFREFLYIEGAHYKVVLSDSSLARLANDPNCMSKEEIEAELRRLLFDALDQRGVVNRRTVKDLSARCEIYQTVYDAAYESRDIETVTRQSWMLVSLALSIVRECAAIQREKAARPARQLAG